MNKNEARKELIKLLKGKGALKDYVREFVLFRSGDSDSLRQFFHRQVSKKWLTCCFSWLRTKRKASFWQTLNEIWQDKLNE